MKSIARSQNTIRNAAFGIGYKMLVLILSFISRTIIIDCLGVEYVGLSTLFTSILSMLNLAELGVGAAIVFSMYDVIAKDDKVMICALLKLYKTIYTAIGLVVLGVGIILSPFLFFFISGDIPDNINVYVLYFAYLINTCLTYFLYAYKNSLFIAYQRNDIISKISAVVIVLQNFLQIIFLIITRNYYIFTIWMIFGTLINNLLINYNANRKFENYKPAGEISAELLKSIKKKVLALGLYKVGSIVLISVDSIVISGFLGLVELGKYNNYYFIITSLFAFFAIFYDSVRAGIGNSLVVETKRKNKKDFDRLFLLNSWFAGWCFVCLVCIYEPFMSMWVGDSLTYPLNIICLMALYFYVWKMMEIVNLYKDAAGMWEYDKLRPIVAAAVNLILNIILVQIKGISGILLSTILSILFVILPWSTIVLFKYFFNEQQYGLRNYFIRYGFYALTTLAAAAITYSICEIVQANTIFGVLKRGLICIVCPNIIFITVFSFDKYFSDTVNWVADRLKRKNHD